MDYNNIDSNSIPAYQDDFDYETNEHESSFKSFLHHFCSAKNVKFVGFNDNVNLANVGVDASFTISKSAFYDLMIHYNPLLKDDLNKLYNHIKTSQIEMVEKYGEDKVLKHDLKENGYVRDGFYFTLEIDFDYPRFSKKSYVVCTPQANYIDYPYVDTYYSLMSEARDLFYSAFKEWFAMQYQDKQHFLEQIKTNDYEILKKTFLRDNLFEQQIVINKIKDLLAKENANK